MQLAASDAKLRRALEAAKATDLPAVNYDEAGSGLAEQDAMATEKLEDSGVCGGCCEAGEADPRGLGLFYWSGWCLG